MTFVCPNPTMSGGDIAVGQRWRGFFAYIPMVGTITELKDDGHAILESNRGIVCISYGSLLAHWEYLGS